MKLQKYSTVRIFVSAAILEGIIIMIGLTSILILFGYQTTNGNTTKTVCSSVSNYPDFLTILTLVRSNIVNGL